MSSRTRAILRDIARKNMKDAGIRKVNRNMYRYWKRYVPTTSTVRRKKKRTVRQ